MNLFTLIPSFRFNSKDWPDLRCGEEFTREVLTKYGRASVVIHQEEGWFSCCEPQNDPITSTVKWNGNEITNIGQDFDHPHWPVIQGDFRENFYHASNLVSAVEFIIEATATQLGNKFWVYELDVADRDCKRYQDATDYWRNKSEPTKLAK